MLNFQGEIRLGDYHAVNCLDSIMTLIHNFKNDFGYEIDKINTIELSIEIDLGEVLIELESAKGVSDYRAIKIICNDNVDINGFNDIYKYFYNNLKYEDIKEGDTVYYNREEAIVKSIIDDTFIEIEFPNGDARKEYKCWALKFN